MSGFAARIVSLLSGFLVRTIFIHYLSADYLGVNGLYSNILSMLSLADLGFGTAMVYSMYKPLADKNYNKLRSLLQLYKRVYFIVGTMIFVIGISLVPFLEFFIKNPPEISGLTFYYILFLLNSCMSYGFFAYRNSIITADQKSYIISNYQTMFNLIKSVLQIILLVVFHSFTIYLITQILCTIGQNVAVAIKAQKLYPVFGKENVERLSATEKETIFKDVGALSLNRIAHVALNSTDNIIISSFVGISWVGLLSNYLIITEAITGILSQITAAMTSSIGNFFVEKDEEEGYHLYLKVDFINYWLYGFSSIAFIILLNPFVTLWLSGKYLLDESIVIAIAVNFFVAGFMNTLWTFRSTLGLFTQGKYRPVIVAVINICLSIALSSKLGMLGVLAATSISRACVNLWYDPWLIHRDGFHKSVKPFCIKYIFRIVLILALTAVLLFISNYIFSSGITVLNFIIMTIIVSIFPNIVFVCVFHRTDEFRYFAMLSKKIVMNKVIKH